MQGSRCILKINQKKDADETSKKSTSTQRLDLNIANLQGLRCILKINQKRDADERQNVTCSDIEPDHDFFIPFLVDVLVRKLHAYTKTRRNKKGQDKTRQDNHKTTTRQDKHKTRHTQDKARQDKTQLK
jgi:hypothetical protein